MAKTKYFNFPIILLVDFIQNHKTCLNNICDYVIYKHSLKLEYDTEISRIRSSAKYYNLTLGSDTKTLNNGKKLYNELEDGLPMVGLNLDIFWDYYKNDTKNEFQIICLLGFLSIKSILQRKAFCKIDNKYWLSRMDGKTKSCEFECLSFSLQKYANEYQTKKIKHELIKNWNLITYSRYTRGFYVSFTLSLYDLAFEAEKRRKMRNMNKIKEKQNDAYLNAVKRLNN